MIAEIHSKAPPHTIHAYPVYIPQPDYDYNSNLSSELTLDSQQQYVASSEYLHNYKNKHRRSRNHSEKGKSKRSQKVNGDIGIFFQNKVGYDYIANY